MKAFFYKREIGAVGPGRAPRGSAHFRSPFSDSPILPKTTQKKMVASQPIENPFEGDLKTTFDNWLAYKKEKNQSYKPQGLKSLITTVTKNVQKYGAEAVIDVIEYSMSNNYQGIIFDSLNKSAKQNGTRSNKQNYAESRDFFDD